MNEHASHQDDDAESDDDIKSLIAPVPSTGDSEAPPVSDEDLKALEDERALMSETFEDMGRRLIKESLPVAIRVITDMAAKGGTDTIRLKAAQYIVDRNLGPVAAGGGDLPKSKREELLDQITTTIPAV